MNNINNINKMKNLHIILIIILVFSLLLNYLSFKSKKSALQLVNEMGIGYNLGNTFNCCNIIEYGKNSENEEIKLLGKTLLSKNKLKEIRKNGFKTIRFQILYNNYVYDSEKINSELIKKIKEFIILISKLDMYLILSIKHSREFWNSEGNSAKVKYINFWKQIANELINYDEHLIFESMYEIGYLKYLERWNDFYEDKEYYLSQDFINIIRESGGNNIERLLIIPMITSDYELNLFNYDYAEYKVPKDPYNKLAISIYYYFPCEDYNPLNILDSISLYDIYGYFEIVYPVMEWGSSQNYKNIISNFNYMNKNFIDKGFPVMIGEVGILNDYIKKNNSIEQLLYSIFSMSFEHEGILPCLWDIPIVSTTYKNFYFNKESSEWSNDKYQKIFNKISKGKFIKSLDYYYQTNLETEDISYFGYYTIDTGQKRIMKIFVNVRFFVHINDYIVMTVYSSNKDSAYLEFNFKEKDGKRQYDGTSIFTVDGSEIELSSYAQVTAWFGEEDMIINNITVQYEEEYLYFDYISYKSDILKEINS